MARSGDLLLPDGFRYKPALVTEQEERALLAEIERLPFVEFQFHGFTGKRRVVSFGWKYDFNDSRVRKVEDIPDFLLPLRDKAAAFAESEPAGFEHVLVTEYSPGSTIGWHKDRSVFDDVIGISLLSPCTFRFRRKERAKWARASLRLEPRSAYLLQGPARSEWEHSIPAVDELRYSITLRNFRSKAGDRR